MFQYSPILGRFSIWDLKYTFSDIFNSVKKSINQSINQSTLYFHQKHYVKTIKNTQKPYGGVDWKAIRPVSSLPLNHQKKKKKKAKHI